MSDNGRNTSHDGRGYDHSSCTHGIEDANNLYEAWLKAKAGSDWKGPVQKYEMDWLHQTSVLKKDIVNRTYKPSKPTEFCIRERGKERPIFGEQVRDRVLEHDLNDNAVIPSIRPYLIYDNGASLEGKGIDFTRRRVVAHLRQLYNKHGNDGYVLLMDYQKYYDNIRHRELMDLFRKYIHDDTALYLLETIVDGFKVDVSGLDYDIDTLFDSLEYRGLEHENKGEKYLYKHLDIGNQTSQSAGILYPTPLDNYIKIVRGVKFYDRYMDDSQIIHQDKGFLQDLKEDCIEYAREMGITINRAKTRIVRLSDSWRFLQIQYSLTDSGRIMRKINPKRVTTMKRKMKKLAPVMSGPEFENWVYSWIRSERKYLSHKQYGTIVKLYDELKGETLCTQ